MTAGARTVEGYFGLASATTHGGGRRPSKDDLRPLDLAAIAAWNAANLRARRAYYAVPNAVTRKIYKGSW